MFRERLCNECIDYKRFEETLVWTY